MAIWRPSGSAAPPITLCFQCQACHLLVALWDHRIWFLKWKWGKSFRKNFHLCRIEVNSGTKRRSHVGCPSSFQDKGGGWSYTRNQVLWETTQNASLIIGILQKQPINLHQHLDGSQLKMWTVPSEAQTRNLGISSASCSLLCCYSWITRGEAEKWMQVGKHVWPLSQRALGAVCSSLPYKNRCGSVGPIRLSPWGDNYPQQAADPDGLGINN